MTLAPGETLELTANYTTGDLGSAKAVVRVSVWNVGQRVARGSAGS